MEGITFSVEIWPGLLVKTLVFWPKSVGVGIFCRLIRRNMAELLNSEFKSFSKIEDLSVVHQMAYA